MIILEEEKLKAYLLSKIKKVNNCWIWQDKSINTSGYAQIKIQKKQVLVHRLSYELFNGKLEKNLVIDHLCRNKLCINPDHLELVTRKENILRGFGPTAINSRKIACKKGHSLTGYNLIIRKTGNRECRTCKNLRKRIYKK